MHKWLTLKYGLYMIKHISESTCNSIWFMKSWLIKSSFPLETVDRIHGQMLNVYNNVKGSNLEEMHGFQFLWYVPSLLFLVDIGVVLVEISL